MAYKITKYKGKHKIKNTKTGESVEIDIEKYMKGGAKYNDGGDFDCDPNDFECQQRKRLGMAPSISSDIEGYVPSGPVQGIIEEDSVNRRPVAQAVSQLTPEGIAPIVAPEINAPTSTDELERYQRSKNTTSSDELVNNQDDIYNIANPYAGVDIPSAANYLGQSIENKSALGIAASSLKIAAGLGRNVVSGLGRQNRYNQVMKDYYKDQKNNKNPEQYFAYGGKKDEELATGEYMHGVMNPETEQYNAEIEKGEYFQTNQGDIAEVVGDKHSSGGEKVQMEAEDRVLSDQLKLGAKAAKMLSEKYDIKLKAKNTYSDVLDKYKRKSKLHKLIEEEADINKKIGEQDNVTDSNTKDFNLQVLAKKKQDIAERKHPIEEQRKLIFDELFDMQEDSKPKTKDNTFAYGGMMSSLAKEYNIPLDRAKELISQFSEGGKIVPKYSEGIKIGDIDPITGKKVTKEEAEKKVASGEWESLGRGRFVDRGTDGSTKISNQSLRSYRETWDKNKFPNFEDYVSAAEQWKIDNPNWNKGSIETTPGTPDEFFYTQEQPVSQLKMRGIEPSNQGLEIGPVDINIPRPSETKVPLEEIEKDLTTGKDKPGRENNPLGSYLFPDETPLPPSSLQGTIKPERRFDRVTSSEIDAEPYLQDIRDREASQVQSLEGLSPNVRAAVLSNMRANSQNQESNIRNQIDAQNIQSKERAIYANAQIQSREENASEADRLAYEQRQYRAQALTDNDLNNYYNQLQSVNKQRFMDIHNLNLINATNEDVYFDGQNYKRKTSDRDILRQVKV